MTVSTPPILSASESATSLIDDFSRQLVKRAARRLVGKFGFSFADRDDLEQTLLLDLLQRSAKFDPARLDQRAFVTALVRQKVKNLIRAQRQSKRRGVQSESDLAIPAEGSPLDRAIVNSASAELQAAVQETLQKLSPRQRAICLRLPYESEAQIARKLKISRKVLQRQLDLIRQRFRAAGLGGNVGVATPKS